MKSVTQAFKDALESESVQKEQVVYYKRSYWSPATKTYVWEADWTLLPQSEVEKIGPLVGKLDTEQMNEFKISNVDLSLKNERHQWSKRNPAGYFGPDAASPIYGYSPYWTKFKIRTGIKLASGTMEYVDDFIGVGLGPVEGTGSPVAQVTVQGLEALLMKADAEDVSTTVTREGIGTGDNSTKDFTTANTGVGVIDEIHIDGLTQDRSLYDITQLNELALGAKISFKTAPVSGAITCTYKYWKQNQEIKDLVEDLLTAAGVATADQQVDPVLFPNVVTNIFTQDAQADWLAGTLDGTDATLQAGDVIVDHPHFMELYDDFNRADGALGGDWIESYAGATVISSNRAKMDRIVPSSGPAYIEPCIMQDAGVAHGAWEFTFQLSSTSASHYFDCVFLGNLSTKLSDPFLEDARSWYCCQNGYFVRVTPTAVQLYKAAVPSNDYLPEDHITLMVESPQSVGTSAHTIKITRNIYGTISVKFDGSEIINITDTTYSTPAKFALQGVFLSDGAFPTVYLDDVSGPATADIVATHVSEWLDAISPKAWGLLTPTQDSNGATITYETQASADMATLDAYVPCAANGQVLSAVKRYLRVKTVITNPPNNTLIPAVHKYTLAYQNNSTVISLANFTGMTVYDAIQELGKFANYEFGFMGGETFYFRSKSVVREPVIELIHNKNLVDISDFKDGYDNLYSEVEATYGVKKIVVKDAGDYPESAKALVGKKVFEVDGGDILVPEDTNIAEGMAALFFAYLSVQRATFKARCKLLPHVQLSDVARVTFNDFTPGRPFYMGDTSVEMGDQSLEAYGSAQQIVDKMLCKVIGHRHDWDTCISELELEGIRQ